MSDWASGQRGPRGGCPSFRRPRALAPHTIPAPAMVKQHPAQVLAEWEACPYSPGLTKARTKQVNPQAQVMAQMHRKTQSQRWVPTAAVQFKAHRMKESSIGSAATARRWRSALHRAAQHRGARATLLCQECLLDWRCIVLFASAGATGCSCEVTDRARSAARHSHESWKAHNRPHGLGTGGESKVRGCSTQCLLHT